MPRWRCVDCGMSNRKVQGEQPGARIQESGGAAVSQATCLEGSRLGISLYTPTRICIRAYPAEPRGSRRLPQITPDALCSIASSTFPANTLDCKPAFRDRRGARKTDLRARWDMADQETFSGAACCKTIELPRDKAAPLQPRDMADPAPPDSSPWTP